MARNSKNSEIKLDEILPKEYLTLSKEEKKIVCISSITLMVELIAYSFGKEYTEPDMFKDILELTINQYEKNENYEACLVLKDMLTLVDEL
jgi:uncharacterized membrane protein YvbJ